MISVNRSALAVIATCSVAFVTFAGYLIFYHRKAFAKFVQKPRKPKSEDILSYVKRFQKDNLEPKVAEAIETLLSCSDVTVRHGFLFMLHQASSFTRNYSVIRSSGCLEKMLSLLDTESVEPKIKRQNLIILQTVTNLACDESALDTLQTIFRIGSTTDYSDQACAALQLLCNIALTPRGCRLLDGKAQKLLELLATRDPYMLRQILSVLINLSCDTISLELLLQTVVPDDLMETFVFALSPSVQPLISVQAVTLMKNLYNSVRDRDSSHRARQIVLPGCTMLNFLLVSEVAQFSAALVWMFHSEIDI
ncbi:hypothetical protein D915_009003 [Fasciola hepatica]|uniref:Armadillo repeat-containing domain-containing protein n=1 Tax=Fasciola hepatica TaxID=6192 RepID=A0A4E0QXX7_FASHE|nr:hypothetical protein D915_009003 [Fasciola hepatica]